MKRINFFIAAFVLLLVLAFSYQDFRFFKGKTEYVGMPNTDAKLPQPEVGDPTGVHVAYGKLPLSFEANQGQTDDRVKFIARGRGYSLFLTSNEAVLSLRSQQPPGKTSGSFSKGDHATTPQEPQTTKRSVLRMKLMGVNPAPQVVGLEELPGKSNYFIGNDPTKWRTNIPTYAKIKHQAVYPGVDLVYYGNQGQLEYDFVVAPGADPKSITLGFEGADKIEVDAEGDLVLHTTGGQIRQHKPLVYQQVDGMRKEVAGGYALNDKNQVSFWVEEYDVTKPLVVDPVLVYSTFLGGSTVDEGEDIAVDTAGRAHVTGFTNSSDFPTTAGAFQTTIADRDAFVSKLNAEGSALVYSTYLGGSGSEEGEGIAIDADGLAHLTGSTNSADFPTTAGAFQTTPSTAFVTKLNIDGSALVYSTYLGGSVEDIAVDANGLAHVTGQTSSPSFPITVGAFQTTFGGISDAFVTKLNMNGSALVYSTYLGGSGSELGEGIAVDAAGRAHLTGFTLSTNFPTTGGAAQTTLNGSDDAFVTSLSADGSALVYSTYLGGSGGDSGEDIVIDADGQAHVIGMTSSTDFPTTAGAFQTALGGGEVDAFVAKLNASGSTLVFSTYLGGSGFDECTGIAVDVDGRAHVVGKTESVDFPTTADAFQTAFGGVRDAFMTKLNADGSALVYSTYLGGSVADEGEGIAVDADGRAYVTGHTNLSDFPTTAGAFQTTYGGNRDAFVVVFAPGTPTEPGMNVSVEPPDESTGETPVALTFSNVTEAGITQLNTSSGGPLPPAGFVLGIPTIYYDLNTTATFTGAIEVCIDYSNVTFINESTLQLFHFEGGVWVDRTSSHDPVNNIICAQVTSLSPFAIFERKPFVFLAQSKITLKRTKQHTPAGDMHSNGALTVEKGDPSTYNSNLTAVGKITIQKDNTINGDVTSQTSISNSGTINGTPSIGSVATEPLPSLSYGPVSGSNKTVPSGGSLTLAPEDGPYGIVTINKGGTLKLSSGEYFMKELRASSSGIVIEIDLSPVPGEVTINVESNLQLGKEAEIRLLPNGEEDSELVTFNTLQNSSVSFGKEAYLLGSFNAPSAKVTLVKNTQLRGSICAKEILVERDCLFLHHESLGSLPGPGNLPKSSADEDEQPATSNEQPVTSYQLEQNYPNPFNPTTTISFALPQASEVTLSIFNTNGQLVRKLVAGEMNAGQHSFTWDSTNERGEHVASGVYLYVIKAGEFTAQKKLVLMK